MNITLTGDADRLWVVQDDGLKVRDSRPWRTNE